MTLQRIPGGGLLLMPPLNTALGFITSARFTCNASTHKIAVMGHVWTPDGGAKSLRKIHFLTGSVSLNSASQITIACQDIDSTTSNPPRGDGTDDQTVAIAGSAITANSWITSGALSADRSVSFGDELVLEFRYSTFTAADSWQMQFMSSVQSGSGNQSLPAAYQFTGTWGTTSYQPNILLEFSDGTFGCFDACPPASGASAVSFTSASTPDERALKFSIPFKACLNGIYANVKSFASLAHFDFVLYAANGSTVVASKTCNGAFYLNSDAALIYISFPETTIDANTTYYLSMKPTTANNCRYNWWTVAASGHKAVWPLGTNGCMSTRTDAGSWTDTDTAIPMVYPRFNKFDDGSGGFRSVNIKGGADQ